MTNSNIAPSGIFYNGYSARMMLAYAPDGYSVDSYGNLINTVGTVVKPERWRKLRYAHSLKMKQHPQSSVVSHIFALGNPGYPNSLVQVCVLVVTTDSTTVTVVIDYPVEPPLRLNKIEITSDADIMALQAQYTVHKLRFKTWMTHVRESLESIPTRTVQNADSQYVADISKVLLDAGFICKGVV